MKYAYFIKFVCVENKNLGSRVPEGDRLYLYCRIYFPSFEIGLFFVTLSKAWENAVSEVYWKEG